MPEISRNKTSVYESLLPQIEERLKKEIADRKSFLQDLCDLLRDKVAYFDWVGFYLVDPENPRELILGPYAGAQTDHTRIAFGQGICGQAAEREETFVVQDVGKENNYLSCSIAVKSEIVIPVFRKKRIVGELDIDSHSLAPFSEEDRRYLERICEMISPVL